MAEDEVETDRDQVGRIADEIGHLFAQTRSMSVRAANGIDPSLQVAGLRVIRWLGRYGPATAGAVAAGTSMDKSAVSRQVRALRDLGLIESEPDPEDGRSVRLCDFASAGVGGTPYRSWLEVRNVGKTPFSRTEPLRSGRIV